MLNRLASVFVETGCGFFHAWRRSSDREMGPMVCPAKEDDVGATHTHNKRLEVGLSSHRISVHGRGSLV